MDFLTDRKKAEGRGASHTGTEHHWYMQVTAVALALIVPTFLYIFGSALGLGHEAVVATFSRPIPAILTGLVLVGGLLHFNKGAQMVIEDYVHGSTKKVVLILLTGFTYALMATGLFALAKIAL